MLTVMPSTCRGQIVHAIFKSSFLDRTFEYCRLTKKIRLQALLHDSAASEEAVPLPEFLVKVTEEKVPADNISYINVPSCIYYVFFCESDVTISTNR